MKILKYLTTKIAIILSVSVILSTTTSFAQEYKAIPLTGPQIFTGNVVDLLDPICGSPTCGGTITECSYLSYIELGVGPLNDPDATYLAGDYTLDVDISVNYVNSNGNLVLGDLHSLQVQFDKDGGTFVNKDRVLLDGGYNINVQIQSINYQDPTGASMNAADIPTSVALYPGIITERFEPLDPLSNNASIDYPNTGFDYFIDLDWGEISGAKSYDLEWTWVDDELIVTSSDEYNFKYNSTRINTENSSYRISNVYRKGILVARVRGVGHVNNCEEEIKTIWNLPNTDNLSALQVDDFLPLNGHREDFNWQHSRVYAEQGKHKDVISYFDGSLRSRQSISRLESDGHAIVAENYYDHVGRATVQSLPTPFIQESSRTGYAENIDYYDNFNTHGGTPYNREHFEKDDPTCLSTPDDMDDTSGAGRYYSSNNPITGAHQAYLPDANGFPFSQTIYTQDQTGRVRFQGGVGNTHQIGNGHETKFYYGVPEQQELDRLFGNDVGYAQYYEKNLTVDANGQVSISYLDNKGRVIATALAGDSPDQLDKLPSFDEALNFFTVNSNLSELNEPSNEGTAGAALSITKQFPVSADGTTYTYDYTLTPQDFTDSLCAPTICFDCAYELVLVVYDECGNVVMGDEASVKIDPSLIIDNTCEVNQDYSPTALSQALNIGSYGLNKKLTLDAAAMNEYEKLYLDAYTCTETAVEIFEDLISNADLEGCVDANCLSLCTSVILVGDYANDLEGYKTALTACLEEKIADGSCTRTQVEDIGQCAILRKMLIADLSPFGQYGTIMNAENEIQQFDLPCTSIYAADNIFGISYDEINYGGITVEVNGVNQSPKNLNLSQFAAYFEDSWIDVMLPHHPEYPYLVWCESVNAISETFDDNLIKYTAQEALDSGYLNPLGVFPNIVGYDIGGAGTMITPGALVLGMSIGPLSRRDEYFDGFSKWFGTTILFDLGCSLYDCIV